ncbi:YdiU family protein [Flavobacteriaceae bacterium Ap0902]|nr:YdiU family protein [Flavobacteriaceae bacterium Ap0902]
MKIKINQPFIDKFAGDRTYNPMQRQTPEVLYALVNPIGYPKAELIHYNKELAKSLGFGSPLTAEETDLLNANPPGDLKTYATAYAGHQFGNWAGQLGDGRAIGLGEILDDKGNSIELQWKGAGATPYSRHADGRAVLRSTIREYLMSEAMFHLGVPTTRSLSISLSGEDVMRDIMYNGNPALEPGAVMIRTAKSFIRFGHFQFLTANGKIDALKNLADWVIGRYYPSIQNLEGKDKYIAFLTEVQDRTICMIIDWYRVGFVHGVMNTDNMSILGLTIDYGPYAMMEEYDLKFTSNTTDLPGRRYAFGQQGNIALWNINALANALYPLIDDTDAIRHVLDNFEPIFWKRFDVMMSAKLGLDLDDIQANQTLIKSWQLMMLDLKLDYTLFFVELMKYRENGKFNLENICYQDLSDEQRKSLDDFLKAYDTQLENNTLSKQESLKLMREANPQFILRNYQLYDAIQDAEKGNYAKFEKLYEALQNPYENKFPELQQKRPDWVDGVPGCSMLSCSS